MELTVLGASGTWPAPGGATCGYLVRHDGTNLWLDAGTGTFAKLQEYITAGDIDAIIVSHGHPDHFVDVVPAFYARHYGRLGAIRGSPSTRPRASWSSRACSSARAAAT